ncbi:MAG: hypothetical protein AAF962_01635 [Actinomycetota bacterium]
MTDVQPSAPTDLIDPEELTESVSEMLDALLDTNPQMLEVSTTGIEGAVEGLIEILGATPALARVHGEMSLALRLAAGFGLVGDDGQASLGDAVEAFSEFVNLVGGALKLLIADESSLGIPAVSIIDADNAGGDEFVLVEHALGLLAIDVRGR